METFLLRIFTLFYFLLIIPQVKAQKLAVVPYVSGISSPIDLKNCGDNRLFVADKGGLIRVINADGTLRVAPFLNISSKVHRAPEDGLLGLAFSPGYKTGGKFYVDYIDSVSGVISTVIEEYKVNPADSNLADLSSALTILTLPQPFDNHVGGNIMFGKDGYLYINLGDGDSETDPNGYGQNTTTLLGKILRIDVSNSSVAHPYVIPASNPFYNDPTSGIKKEIWASGVRNPWRSSMDRLTGDLWIADVGQYTNEEVDYQPANDAGGRNYGWNIMEGNSCYNPPTGCNTTGLTLPIYQYSHPGGSAAIISGYVYRSAQSKSLFGTYIFGDYVKKWIDGIQQSGSVLSGSVTHLIAAAEATGNPISFGEDRLGDQYLILSGNGTIYKLQDTSYLRRPKAYFTPIEENGGTSYLLQGLQGRNLTYKWLRNNVAIGGATLPDYTLADSGNYSFVVTNDLGFSDTSDVFSFGSLPLNLISFTAQKILPREVVLQWKTTSEQNISGYTIQRRENNETSFSNLGFVDSKSINGSSGSELDYTFTDSSALNNTKIFYRLQIEHADGSFAYSNIIFVSSDASKNDYIIFPNPAKGQVQLYLNEYTQPVVMVLYDNTGNKIKQQTINQQNSTIELPASKGVYIIQMSNTDGTNKVRKKLVVR